MKGFGKVLFAATMALSLTVGTALSSQAAAIESVTAQVAADVSKEVTVKVTYDGVVTDGQSTMIALKEGTDLATFEVSDVIYIYQKSVETVEESKSVVTYAFEVSEENQVGNYVAYVGGSDIDAPRSAAFSFTVAHDVTGKIVVLGDAAKATAVAVLGEEQVNGTVGSDGAYAIKLNSGTYTVVLGKKGYLYKTYENVVVSDSDVALGEIALLGGDATGDGGINLSDLQQALNIFGADATDFDLDDNGIVNLSELQAVLTNFGRNSYN